jgi:uncharacterized membrane protein
MEGIVFKPMCNTQRLKNYLIQKLTYLFRFFSLFWWGGGGLVVCLFLFLILLLLLFVCVFCCVCNSEKGAGRREKGAGSSSYV